MAISLQNSFQSGLGGKIVSNMGGGGGGLVRRPAGPVPLSPQQQLEEQRKKAEDAIGNVKGMYQAQATGQFQPYGRDVQARMYSQAADQQAGAQRAQAELIRRSFASRGMSNSGGQMASLLGAQNRASANLRRAQSQIQNQAALENFGARERGQAGLAGLLGPELAFRSRYEITGEDPLTAALARLLGGQQGGRQILSSGHERQRPEGGGGSFWEFGADPSVPVQAAPQQFAQQAQAQPQRAPTWVSALAGAEPSILDQIAQNTWDLAPGFGGF